MKPEIIMKKAVYGIKWTVIISILTIGFTYLLQFFLAKISPETLGIYTTFDIFIKTITTFIIFGGAPVLSNYIPKLKDGIKKFNFAISYSLIVFLFMFFSIIIFLLFPELMVFIFKREISNNLFLFLILFTPIVVINFLMQYILNGFLEIKVARIMRNLYIIGTSFIVIFSYFVLNSFLVRHIFNILLISIFSLNVISIIIGFFKVRKHLTRKNKTISFFLPKNFLKFALFIHCATFFAFFEKYILKFYFLSYFSIGQLGVFQFILLFYLGSRQFVIIFNEVLTPIFSSLEHNLRKYYFEFTRIIPLVTLLLNGFVVIFLEKLILLVNKDYLGYSNLIIYLIMFSTLGCLGIINSNILIIKEKTFILMLNGILQILLVLTFYFIFNYKLSLFIIITLQGLLLLISQVLPFLYVLFYKYKISINYFMSVFSILLLSFLKIILNISLKYLILMYFIILVVVFKINYKYLVSTFKRYREVLI